MTNERARRAVQTRISMPLLAVTAAWVLAPLAPANAAPAFDVEAYSTCTATTLPGPGQDFDSIVTECCVRNAGVPAPTNYGMGCVATPDAASADERPTIVLPTRPVPPEKGDGDLDGLIDLPIPDPAP
ncbi:hypothetical protein [Mycolicibacterium sp. 050158]|uniref:hypothetical protein n=1 Tax=Mycolicibacterium sp. 050158 TaxID=3090602 RepID=UPI00299F2699|nr:hypothetical protein [Mycolicibacterium sp. 050158]MDX1889653.1 hypothetical protein [Mycolicibacterium sp. 050158]